MSCKLWHEKSKNDNYYHIATADAFGLSVLFLGIEAGESPNESHQSASN